MSDGDGDVESSCSTSTSYESSLKSKPSTSTTSTSSSLLPSSSSSTSCQPLSSPSAPLYNFVNYDPFCYRNRSHHTSTSSVTFFVCRSIGLGCLCMPYAFQQVGAAVGLVICLFTGLMFNYSYTLLCRLRYKICQIHRVQTVPYYSYQNLIEYSLALGPRVISNFTKLFKFSFIIMNLALNFGTSCLYTKFVSMTIQELLNEMRISVNGLDTYLIYTVLCFGFLLVPSSTYFECLNILSQIACTILLCYIYIEIFTANIEINNQSLIVGDWTDVFQFFGILLFSFIPVVQSLKIEDELIRPEDYVGLSFGLLSTSMVIMTNMYIAIGLWGYLAYKNVPKIGYSILKVMPATRFQSFVKLCFVIHIAISHQELCSDSVSLWSSTIAAAAVKKLEEDKTCRPSIKQSSSSALAWLMAATKVIFTAGSFLVAVTVLSPLSTLSLADPNRLEHFMALTGYLGNAWNVLVFPYTIELCLTHALHGMSVRPYVIAKDVIFIIFGLLTFIYGTYTVMSRILCDISDEA